jgi:hypothetical protein
LHRKEKGGQGEDDLSMRVVPRESVEKSRPGAKAPGLFECIGNSDPLYRRLAGFYFEFKNTESEEEICPISSVMKPLNT